jgi:hypothetical protein
MLANNHEQQGMAWMMTTRMDILQELRGFSVHHSKGQEKKGGTLGGLQRSQTRRTKQFPSFSRLHFIRLGRTHILDHSGSRSLCTGIGSIGIFARRSETAFASPSCPVRSMHFMLQY